MRTVRVYKVALSKLMATREKHLIKNITLTGSLRSIRFGVLWYNRLRKLRFDTKIQVHCLAKRWKR
jgi:hypothetical protein